MFPKSVVDAPSCLKATATRFNTNVAFSFRMRLKQRCKRVNNDEEPQQCAVKHANKFVLCEEKKVYSVPLGCGDK